MIQLNDVWYRLGNQQIFSGINLHVAAGEFVCLLGKSGAGKSSLLNLIHMETMPTRGKIEVVQYHSDTIRAREIPYFRRKVSMIFQDFQLLEDRNVYENVAFALYATGFKRSRIKRRVFEVLAEVGLSHKRYKMVKELSGGEQQRVAIARSLANEPYVLLADEPTGNLDPEASDEIHKLLKRINVRGMTILMVTHKVETVRKLSSRILTIQNGKILE